MKTRSRNQARKAKHVRLRQNLAGTASKPRLNVFKSHQNLYAQLIDDSKGVTLASASTLKDTTYGGNVKAASALGHVMGQKIKALKFDTVVFDRGGYIFHGRVKAFAEAVREEGIKL
ncbi:50S ribosomal protein L18 [Mycoplasma nasistruthionis]|uniref:Large ribosomal subunit protein uL18 n=1 Tax=Mycoplasma nasistruthionis TaxID=353852 RepID=A0A4Y6I780_9MOLU|nr:50S ribosomal protein L18 [Mycoplasma nasistruthionis]QCZ36818.1 50S ribosomal protein L18 [Mycoplasma nasistruthionis]QDF65097.1 50S ribosomal protein L18 [Mycoplasma nasistruthionis]